MNRQKSYVIYIDKAMFAFKFVFKGIKHVTIVGWIPQKHNQKKSYKKGQEVSIRSCRVREPPYEKESLTSRSEEEEQSLGCLPLLPFNFKIRMKLPF